MPDLSNQLRTAGVDMNCATSSVALLSLATLVSGTPDVALVMMDTRDPHDVAQAVVSKGFKLQRNASVYYFLTYYLNLRYATAHGYELLYYRMDAPTCQHPLWGARHPSYCKLTAIAHTMALDRHRWVMWIDSDAFVRNTSLPLPALLRAYGAPVGDASDFFFGWDSPYTLGPNAGFFVARNTAAARAMLRTWWNVYSGQYGLEHSYEQHTLQWQTMHLDAYRRALRTLSLRTMEPETPDAVVHLDHNAGTKARLWIMGAAAAELLETTPGAVGADERARKWAKALGSLRQKWERGRKQGRRTLELVLKVAARQLLGMSPPSSSAASARPMRLADGASAGVSASASASAAATDAAFAAIGESGGTSTTVASDATATATAAAAATAATADAKPLSLDATAAGNRLLMLRSDERPEALLRGMPLHVVNCTADGAPLSSWQRWRVRPGPPTKEGNATTLYSLAAYPRLCFGLGVTRAPKQPYLTLATLGRCEQRRGGRAAAVAAAAAAAAAAASVASGRRLQQQSSSAVSLGGAAAGAMRATLEHVGATGHLRTVSKQRSLRRKLPELDPACGFWPNCTRTHFVLQKRCWRRLLGKGGKGGDLNACGDSEPVLTNLIRRGREVRMNDGQYLADAKPGWRRVAIGPSGPVPEAALTMGPSDRLCLTVWRSTFVEGAPAVFVACPKTRSRNARAAAKAEKADRAARRVASEAAAKARARGASAAEAAAAAKMAAAKLVRKTEVKVETKLHEEGFGAASHSSWMLRGGGGGSGDDEEAGGGKEGGSVGEGHDLRIVPRSAPHMCLGVPPLIRADADSTAIGAAGVAASAGAGTVGRPSSQSHGAGQGKTGGRRQGAASSIAAHRAQRRTERKAAKGKGPGRRSNKARKPKGA